MPEQNDPLRRDAAVNQGVEGRLGIGIHGGLGRNAWTQAEPAIVDVEDAETRALQHLAMPQLVCGEGGSRIAVKEQYPVAGIACLLRGELDTGDRDAGVHGYGNSLGPRRQRLDERQLAACRCEHEIIFVEFEPADTESDDQHENGKREPKYSGEAAQCQPLTALRAASLSGRAISPVCDALISYEPLSAMGKNVAVPYRASTHGSQLW